VASKTEFSGDQYAEAYPPGVEDTYWHIGRNRIIMRQIQAAKGSKVLDVGCGRGILVNYLVEHGADCYGVELAEVTVPEALGSRIFSATRAEDLPIQLRRSIDVIVLGDVIEHLAEPEIFLCTLADQFPGLKTFIITVPARPELWSNYDEHYGHYRRYTLASLRETVERSRLAVKDLRYMYRLLYLPARMVLLTQGKRPTRIEASGPRWFHALMSRVIQADYSFLPAGVRGTSVICRADVVRG